MRIADTLLRGGHVSDDALADAWYTGVRPAHLDHCDLCAERALELARWLEDTKHLGVDAADAVFTPERLAAQQSQILRKLEQIDRPSKLLSFPKAPAAILTVETPGPVRHSIAGWIAIAAACLILGVVAGRLSVWQPPAVTPVQSAQARPAAGDVALPDVESFPGEIEQLQLNSLRAIESLTTSQVVVARASTTGRGR
ncbi:MAG: hypothetical protein EPO35_00830 [Acidobacteria bacterium]|nr:MAG: hypothetical protein EPO35_00830 [Acidobacteriota bacterium]